MLFEHIISTYGYAAIFIGTLLEGGTILIAGGFLAHSGYLFLSAAILCAFLGSVLSDNILFLAGRALGKKYISRFPSLSKKIEKVQKFIEEHSTSVILGFRFSYGLRTVTPLALGASKVSAQKFVFLNIISAFVWAVIFGSAGYILGMVIEFLFGKSPQLEIVLGILFIGFFVWIVRFLRKR